MILGITVAAGGPHLQLESDKESETQHRMAESKQTC